MKIVFLILSFMWGMLACNKDPQFVFLIPSYNNAEWYEKNLDSITNQTYKNYRIMYIDDASTDGTADLVAAYITKKNLWSKTTLIRNKKRMYMAFNRFMGGHMCSNNEIIVAVDGDDWLKHGNVLSDLKRIYANDKTWMTYGQFEFYPSGKRGNCADIPMRFIKQNSVRRNFWAFMHLRTYYAWLFKLIPEDDFKIKGEWITACTDVPLMYGLVELAGVHYKFISDVNYILNRASPINVCKTHKSLQIKNARIVAHRTPHRPTSIASSKHTFYFPACVQAFLEESSVVQVAP